MYTGNTLQIQHNNISSVFTSHPEIAEHFGDQWTKENLLFENVRNQNYTHPLFFALANEMRNERLANNLNEFKNFNPDKFQRVCKKLKMASNKNHMESCLNEIETYVHMRKRYDSCVWEPEVPNTENKADISFDLNGDKIFVEALSIFSSQSDEEISQTQCDIQARINKLPANHYCVCITYHWTFFDSPDNVDLLIDFVSKQVESGKLSRDPDHLEKMELEIAGTVIAGLSFSYVSDDDQGFVGSWTGPGGARNDSGRIKNTLMSKLQNFQLPVNGKGLGGYLVFLNDSNSGIRDFTDALHGRETVNFFSDGRPATNGRASHESLCSTKEAAEKMVHIHFYVVVNNPSQYWHEENVQVFINTDGQLKKEEIVAAFTTKEREVEPHALWVT